jgi:hypothetical protein
MGPSSVQDTYVLIDSLHGLLRSQHPTLLPSPIYSLGINCSDNYPNTPPLLNHLKAQYSRDRVRVRICLGFEPEDYCPNQGQ